MSEPTCNLVCGFRNALRRTSPGRRDQPSTVNGLSSAADFRCSEWKLWCYSVGAFVFAASAIVWLIIKDIGIRVNLRRKSRVLTSASTATPIPILLSWLPLWFVQAATETALTASRRYPNPLPARYSGGRNPGGQPRPSRCQNNKSYHYHKSGKVTHLQTALDKIGITGRRLQTSSATACRKATPSTTAVFL